MRGLDVIVTRSTVSFSIRPAVFALLTVCFLPPMSAADLADTVRNLDPSVLTESEREHYRGMISRDIERRRRQAIRRENEAWHNVRNREDWEQFRDQRIEALRKSLGTFPTALQKPNVTTTGRIEGDGFRIENIVFESRPGLFVTANLYLPARTQRSMPAVLFSHSHHAPKTHGELQDMGMTWARQGWIVLVPDHVGHGERRQHPFVTRHDYAKPFRVSRQDYYFRYNTGLQLQLVGESLMGWMVWDLMRAVDVLCARSDVDQNRIILVGSVAGGGDPAGVVAALDNRIAAVAPFNFGGPQPDYAIPENADEEFYYFGVAYWETTRCLRLGGRDGFAHWAIVGSVAPRRLIYSFEFGWEQSRDPVWPRLQKVFGFYNARDSLDTAIGKGHLKGRPPENTHCGNVGAFHRRKFYPHLKRWFDMQPPDEEFQQRRNAPELTCMTPSTRKQLDPKRVHQLARNLGTIRVSSARKHLGTLTVKQRRRKLQTELSRLIGDVDPNRDPRVIRETQQRTGNLAVTRVLLESEDDIVIPVAFLSRSALGENKSGSAATVVMFAQAGREWLLKEQARQIANLLDRGATVCIPELRGTGETRSGSTIGPRSTGTDLSCRDQVLGQTLLASRLRDLRSVLRYVRNSNTKTRIAIWGTSSADPNPADRKEVVPHGIENPNTQSEPTAGLVALLTALYENDIKAIYADCTFASFDSMLQSPFLYVPHDAVVPGVLTVCDITDITSAIAPRALKLGHNIDGLNRRIPDVVTQKMLAPTVHAYKSLGAESRLAIKGGNSNTAEWILSHLK